MPFPLWLRPAAPLLVGFFLVMGSSGCSSAKVKKAEEPLPPSSELAPLSETPPSTQVDEDSIAKLDEGIEEAPAAEEPEDVDLAGLREMLKNRSRIPSEVNAEVRKWIHYFTVRDRERFQRFMERGEPYRAAIQATLREHGVPAELYYLAMIESGYVLHAKSHAAAVGFWQFMQATGRRYGLYSGRYVDERRDPVRATEAAARHLRDLHGRFKSWHLALAAYNAGEGRISRAVSRAGTRDFWELARRRALPNETMNYVPKFLAAVAIGQEPAKFGFSSVRAESAPNLEAVSVPSPVKLKDVAKLSGVPLSELEEANPHLKLGITSVAQPRYEIWVPEERALSVRRVSARLAAFRLKGLREGRGIALVETPRTHRVERGETLYSIARSYQVPVAYLLRQNGLRRGSSLRQGQQIRIAARVVKVAGSRNPARTVYRVRTGDTLHRIARKTGIPTTRILRMNPQARGRLIAGQVLHLNVP